MEIGNLAPDFTLMGSDGKEHKLSDYIGKKVILYFYPKDNTPGCTTEACDFRDNIDRITNQNAIVVGISKDNLNSHNKFIEKFNLPFILLSDEDKIVCELYDVIKEKNMYGKKVLGIERSTFIINEEGYLIKDKEEFIKKVTELNKRNVDFIMQENIKSSYGKDIRVNIIGNKVIGAMLRESDKDFRANISQGGKGKLINLTTEQEEIALKAHKVLGLDFSGVDLLFGEDNKPILCEVNSNLNFLSFEELWGKSFGAEILKYILEECL